MSWFKAGSSWLWDTFKVAWPLWGATLVTAGFACWVYLLAQEVTLQAPYRATRWEHFLHGRPNELGDALAGFVGSLTLIWVVASVIQQSMELKAQRQEFIKMVDAQDEQVRALQAQAEIFEDERKYRIQEAFSAEFVRLISGISQIIKRSKDHESIASWLFGSEKLYRPSLSGPTRRSSMFEDLDSPDEIIYLASISAINRDANDIAIKAVQLCLEETGLEVLRKVLVRLNRIVEIKPQLPRSDVIRIHDLGLELMQRRVDDVTLAILSERKRVETL